MFLVSVWRIFVTKSNLKCAMKLPKLEDAMQKKTCKPLMLSRMWLTTKRALSLEHWPAQQFGCCQWQSGVRPSVLYLIYRWVLFVGVVSTGVCSFVYQRLPRNYTGPVKQVNYFKWFIYFTNWGILVMALHCGLALMVVHRYRNERSFNITCEEDDGTMLRRRKTPLLCRMYWLTHTVATDLAFVITLVYWALVYDDKIHEMNLLNLLVHGGNTVVMVCELLTTAHPVRVAHALYGAGAGLGYGIFSAFYWALGGTDRQGEPAIYPPLDWSKPGSALGFVTMCACVLVTAHALAAAMAAVRTSVAARLGRPRVFTDRLALPSH